MMKANVALHPADVSLLSPVAVVAEPNLTSEIVEKAGRIGHSRSEPVTPNAAGTIDVLTRRWCSVIKWLQRPKYVVPQMRRFLNPAFRLSICS